MSRKRGGAVLAVMALAAGALSAAPTASAGHAAVTIQVGGLLGGRSLPAESMRFGGPDEIIVHQGDRITFDFQGFHTATMLPVGADADDWLMENASPTGPFGAAVRDPDDGPNEFKDNSAAVHTPSQPDCGGNGQTPCGYHGDAVVNSGTVAELPGTFTVTVDSQPGTSFWLVCLIHHRMRKMITVADDPATATTQAEIDDVTQQQVADDKEWARTTHARFVTRRVSHRLPNGQRAWDVWAGIDSPTVSLWGFYPKSLAIRPGDVVRWRFSRLTMEDHTVSLPLPGVAFALMFDSYMCDPDGDTGTASDTPSEFSDTGDPVCPDGSTLETDVSHEFWGGAGNGVLKSKSDAEHSGIRGANMPMITPPAGGNKPFSVKFVEATDNKTIKYFCFLHPMNGTVAVR